LLRRAKFDRMDAVKKTKMLKKLTIALLLIIGVQLSPIGLTAPAVFAVSHTSVPSPGPGGDIDSGGFMFNLSGITHEAIEGGTRQGWIRRGVNFFFERAIGFMAAVIGTLSVLMVSIGGFLMLSSAGNENQYNRGKSFVKYALIGLVITLSAYILVTLVQLLIRSIYA